MEGRGRQDGAPGARSRVFSGRQVPLEMGTIRVGGSGRSAPSVFSSTVLKRSLTTSQEASHLGSARSPIVTLEPHPRSPFHRQTEVATTVVRVSDDALGSRFQVKKTSVRNAQSPHVQLQENQVTEMGDDTQISNVEKVYDEEKIVSSSMESSVVKSASGNPKKLQPAVDAAPQRRTSSVGMLVQDHATASSVALALQGQEMEDISTQTTETAVSHARQHNFQGLESQSSSTSGRKMLVLPNAHAGEGTFVSSMPSLTKLHSSFTARELALFTHRLDREPSTEPEANKQTRYHVTSHPYPTKSSPSVRHQTDDQNDSREIEKAQKRPLPASAPQREVRKVQPMSKNHHTDSFWRRVDSSIDHIYENPSIDLVQLHLLHSHHSASGQKKRKLIERERILAAASGLRELQNEEQRRQEQQQQRKLQLQQMSEAIRLQNQRVAMKARTHQAGGVDKKRVKADQQAVAPQRKPPVPRLSGTATLSRHPHPKRKKKAKDDASRPAADVSASILMGTVSEPSKNQIGENIIETPSAPDINDEVTDNYTAKRKSLTSARSPRSSKKKRQNNTPQVTKNPAVIQAKEERRAIAREYMQLQKHSRQIWRAKMKEQSQLEREKRQQQLELVEATRLKNLRLSKKRMKTPEKQRPLGFEHLTEDPATTTALTTIPDSPTPMLELAVEALQKHRKTPPHSRSSDNSLLDETQLDNENIRAVGNIMAPESPQNGETARPRLQSPKASSVGSPVPDRGVKQNLDIDDRVQKLLELREKAAALSARLSGLRNRPNKSIDSVNDMPKKNCFAPRTSNMVVPGDDAVQSPKSSNENSELFEDQDISEGDANHDIKLIDLQNDETSVDSDARSNIGLAKHVVTETDSNVTEIGALDISNDEEEAEILSHTRRYQVTQHALEFNAPSDILGVHEDDSDIDFRTIGVYNIGVVWPGQQQVAEGMLETKNVLPPPPAIPSDSSSSAASSHAGSPRTGLENNLTAQRNANRDEVIHESEEAFETAFYEQMKRRLHASSPMNDDEIDDTTLGRREDHEDEVNNDSESNTHPITDLLQRYPTTEKKIVAQRRSRVGESNQSNAGLMRLLRETDDSLSVIDRAARRLYQQQCEQAEQAKERELQERIDAEKQALLKKDMTLEAVMASLTGKRSNSYEDDMSDAEDDFATRADDDEATIESMQYRRLEEIMEEVENERAREKAAAEGFYNADSNMIRDQEDHLVDRDKDQMKPQDSGRGGKRGVARTALSSSSAFWDQLVSESTENEFDDEHPDHADFERPHVAIDDSELIAQREARLREDDEQMTGHTDSPPRVHSPRTLSRMMMAAFGYHEAISEAHIQLSTIEHAHELETVQTDTITLAQAFKEEMEHSATSHQLALDHATLEKKFDGDMQEVMQQLETIRQGEEHERVLNESRMGQELKQANLRECSVQTEASQRVDAATSAALYVDTSTSPVRFVVDVAVQHDMTESKTEMLSSQVDQSHELDYASEEDDEDAYEETFEKESHAHINVVAHKEASTSEVPSLAESSTQSAVKGDDESEIHSLPSGGEDLPDGDDVVESNEVPSVIDEKSVFDESTPRSAVESAFDEEDYGEQSRNAPGSVGDVSVSMEYGDDFEASSPKAMASSGQLRQEGVDGDDIEDEVEYANSVLSNQNVDDIEEDVDVESSGVKTGNEVTSEHVESDYYSSQFDETSLMDAKKPHNKKGPVAKRVALESNSVKQASSLMLVGDRNEIALLAAPHGQRSTNNIEETYVLDLERRKQAEESLLHLRLQTIDLKFQHELKELENEIKYKRSDGRSVQEMSMRKENLTVAFLAEKANVESLKAASTARYYQDLHTFRSLSLDWPQATGRKNGEESNAHAVAHMNEFAPSTNVAAPTTPAQNQLETRAIGDESDSRQHADEYSNDFVSGQDSGHIVVADQSESSAKDSDIEEVRSHSSAYSEVDGSTADVEEDLGASEMIEEDHVTQEREDDIPDAIIDEENQYDDEFASMSDGEFTQEVSIASDGDVAEDSQVAEKSEENSAHGDSQYEEDFASMSENPVASTKESGTTEPTEIEVEEQNVAEDSGSNDIDDISIKDEIVEDEDSSQKLLEKLHSGEIAASTEGHDAVHAGEIASSNEGRHYSEDAFESGQLEQHATPHFDQEQSVSIVEGQSASEDSSTTKLLVAEVAKLQTLSAVAQQAQNDEVDNKLARKKAKTEELLQAKDLLFKQQKEVFRRDEEKRQVDLFAKMALEMDVEGELRQAKTEIVQHLVREFDALHQTYPMLQANNSKKAVVTVTNEPTPTSQEPAPVISTVLGKSSEKGSIDGYDDDYEVESFEEEQGESRAGSKANSFDVASEGDESQQIDESHKDIDAESEDANSEIVSEAPSHQSGVDEDLPPSVVDEEVEHIEDEQDGDAIGEIHDESGGYENDYENESFDDVQSSVAVLSEDQNVEVAEINEEPEVANASVDDLVEKDEYHDDEDVYSDEGFDSTSGSFAQEPSSISEANPAAFENKTTTDSIKPVATVVAEETSAQEAELAEAIESVAAQLEDERQTRPLDLVHSDYNTQDLASENVADESKPLDTSMSVSISRDEEEGLLTKSIEKRTVRLELLRQRILVRKSEIVMVQKQMRVERRKEQLAAEEKLLWDEMESVERLLYADEAALALCRQRNRLDMMYLEARGVEHSVTMPHNNKPREQESDLLLGFDYIEDAQLDELQRRRGVAVLDEKVAATSRRQTARGLGLLEGYIYIEAAELDHRIPEKSTITYTATPISVAHKSESDYVEAKDSTASDYFTNSKHEENQERKEQEEEDGGKREDLQQVDGECNRVEHSPSDLQTDPWNLLAEYEYVEDVELPSDTRADLLISDLMANFDYVEIVEAVEQKSDEPMDGEVEDLSNVDLLVSFNYVETADIASPPSIINVFGEHPHLSDKFADEDQQAAEFNLGEDEDDNETSSNHPVERTSSGTLAERLAWTGDSLAPPAGSSTNLTDATIEDAEDGDSDVSVEESVKALLTELVASDLDDVTETMDSQPYQISANKAQPTVDSRDEELVDRVATLLLDDLLQTLDKDMLTSVSRVRSQNVDEAQDIEVQSRPSSGDTSLPQDTNDQFDDDFSEVGSENSDIHSVVDRSIDNSIGKASSLDASASYSMDYVAEDDRVSGQSSSNGEYTGSSVRADASNDVPIERSINFTSDTEHVHEEGSVAPDEGEINGTEDSIDKVSMTERVADNIFATIFDTVIMSELQLWSRQHHTAQSPIREAVSARITVVAEPVVTTESAVGIVSVEIAHEPVKQVHPKPRALASNLTHKVLDQLEIVDGKLVLPAFDTLDFETPQEVHALYDTIDELAHDCFDSLQQSAHDEHKLDNASMLAIIHRHVQTEIDELLAIRAQSEGELERQLRLLSDEDGVTSSILLSHNCLESNVSSMVSKVQAQLTRTTESRSTVQTPRSGGWPRTPTSRAKSTSVLSSLQTQQDEELQQRITSMILSDLLHDSGLS